MLKRLLIASGLFVAGTFYAGILGPAGVAGVSVLAGIIANDSSSVWDKIGDRLRNPDILDNDDLTKAVGVAIAAILAKTAKDENKIDRSYRSHIKSLAKYTKNNWVNFYKNELNGLKETGISSFQDANLTKLFLTQPDDFNQVRVFNLDDAEADKKIWGEEIVRKLINKNDVLSRLKTTPQEIEEVNQIIDVLSQALSEEFPDALKKALKEDFAKGGRAYAGFTIDIFAMIQQAIRESKEEIITRLANIENKLPETIVENDNEKLIEILENTYHKTVENQEDLVNLIQQGKTDLNQEFNGVNQQLEALQTNNEEAFKQLGNAIESGFQNIEQLLNNLVEITTDTRRIVTGSDQKIDKILEKVEGIEQNRILQEETSTGIIINGGNPPKLITHWQGRTDEIAQLKTWFSDKNINLVGINGVGGMGKSSLAGKLYEETEQFSQQYWADVGTGTLFTNIARDVIPAFGGTLPQQETQLVDALIYRLQSGKYLLVIDNLETVLTTKGEWQDGFYQEFFNTWKETGKNSTVLITTREKPELKGIEWIDLQGLKTAEGVKLLEELGITGESGKLEDFSALLGGHPLMLRLVGDLLKDEYPQDPDLKWLESLGLGNLQQLLTDEKVTGVHRQETVGMVAILSATVDRLSDAERELWCNLSVYRKPFDKVAANFISREDSETAVEAELRKLVKRSLLQETLKGNTRYFEFQPVVREYALYCVEDVSEAHRQAIAYYQSIAEADPNSKEMIQPYLEGFHHYCELGEYDTAFDVIRGVDNFLTLQGLYTILVESYSRLVKAWENTTIDKWKYSASLTSLGNAYQALGEYHKAIICNQQSLDVAREIGYTEGTESFLNNLGVAYQCLGEYPQAIINYQQSLNIARKTGNRELETTILNNLGDVYQCLGEYPQAIIYHQQSLNIARETGDRKREGNSLGGLGNVYQLLGEYEQALIYHQQSLNIARETGDRKREGNSLGNLGSAYGTLREYKQAIIFFGQSLDISREIGHRLGEGIALGNLGNAYEALREYKQAIIFFKQSLNIFREIEYRQGEVSSLVNLALACQSLGEYQQTITYHQQSLDIAREIGNRREEATAWFNLGLVFTDVQQKDDAKEAFLNARQLFQDMGINNIVERCDNQIKALESDVSPLHKLTWWQWLRDLWGWFLNR